jgi:hypothetical protein
MRVSRRYARGHERLPSSCYQTTGCQTGTTVIPERFTDTLYSRLLAPCTARYPSLLTALHPPGPHTRVKGRLLTVGGQNCARRGLTAGGRWIRTFRSAL